MIRKRMPRRTVLNLETLETRQLLSTAVDQPVTQPSPVETLPADLLPIDPYPLPADRIMPIEGEEVSPLAALPQAPPSTTPPPVNLPSPTDCPTNLPPTSPTSGDSLPAGTANNQFDVNTAATGTTAPVVTSTPAPTAPYLYITPAPTPAPAPAPAPGNDMPLNPETIPPTDLPPTPDIGPEVPASTATPAQTTVASATPIAFPTPTTGSTVGDAAVQGVAIATANIIAPAAVAGVTDAVGAAVVFGSLSGCESYIPVPVDPNGVPIPAPPSSTTNPPAGQVPPSSATPIPTASTTPNPAPATNPNPYYAFWDYGYDFYDPYPSRDSYAIG